MHHNTQTQGRNTTMRCQHDSYFDDMYPGFAPEPIVVRCEKQATHRWTFSEDAADQEGWPRRGVREVVHVWTCAEHAEEVDPALTEWGPFNAKLLRTEVVA